MKINSPCTLVCKTEYIVFDIVLFFSSTKAEKMFRNSPWHSFTPEPLGVEYYYEFHYSYNPQSWSLLGSRTPFTGSNFKVQVSKGGLAEWILQGQLNVYWVKGRQSEQTSQSISSDFTLRSLFLYLLATIPPY